MAARPHVHSLGVPESWVSPGTQLGSQGVTFKTAAVLDLSTPKRASKEDAGRLR